MLFGVLAFIAVSLTVAMFATRNKLLGFPSGIFWALICGYAYTMSTVIWDLYYILFFACFGMTVFSIYAAFALRRSDISGPDDDKGKYIDEESGPDLSAPKEPAIREYAPDDPSLSQRVRRIHERAERRKRSGVAKKRDHEEFIGR